MKPLLGITCGQKKWPEEENAFFAVKASYIRAVTVAGGVPVIIPPEIEPVDLLPWLGGIILSGGGDVDPCFYGQEPLVTVKGKTLAPLFPDPERDRFELVLTQLCLERGIPLLGICRGAQVLNVAGGGTLYQHLDGHEVVKHYVRVQEGSLLYRLAGRGEFLVNSRHHQGVHEIPGGWLVSAWGEDGLPEAIEYPDHPFALGVQWHPEDLLQEREHLALFRGLVEAAAQRTTNGGYR